MVRNKYSLPEKTEPYEFTHDQSSFYYAIKQDYQDTTSDNWRQHLAAMTRFKDAQLVNYEHFNQSTFEEWRSEATFEDLQTNPLYVHATLIKPGKQYYVVQHKTQDESWSSKLGDLPQVTAPRPVTRQLRRGESSELEQEYLTYFLHKALIPLREDPIPLMSKKLISSEVERVFNKDASVFKPWKPDNAASINKCAENDWLAMNLAKLAKEDSDRLALDKVIKKHMPYLKQCHLDLVSTSSLVPYVSELDFVNFYKQCSFCDETVKAANIDLIYCQVNTNQKNIVGINRGEFIEALVRIAKAKYKDTQVCKTLDEALHLLVEKNIKPMWGDSQWHQTRVTKFWTCEVNDLLENNIEGLKRVFTLFWDLKTVSKKKWMDLKEADYFMTQAMPELRLTVNTARRCYLFSKMSCNDENSNLGQYNKMVFVEFLECLCRMALYHYDETHMREWPLIQRLEHVLDNVLLLRNLERKPVVIDTQIDSDADISDEDY